MGIVIPSPGEWLLPELQDIAKTLQTTLQLPPDATIGHGITLEPSSDGILISLPTGARLPAHSICAHCGCLSALMTQQQCRAARVPRITGSE